MKKTYWLIGASIATIGTTLALTSCSQQQQPETPQKKGYLTFESNTGYGDNYQTTITKLSKRKTYDMSGFITSYDPNLTYTLNDAFMNDLLKIKDEWNIYFYHSDVNSYNYKWYNLAEYYNVVYKQIPQ